MSEHQQSEISGAHSVRLIFSYDGEVIALKSRQPVTMTAPPSDPFEGGKGRTGSWIEVRDAKGAVLHRRAMHDPVRRFVEVFSPDPEQPITYVPVREPHGAFAVLVPIVPGADHVAVMGAAPVRATALTSSVELHRVSLTGESS